MKLSEMCDIAKYQNASRDYALKLTPQLLKFERTFRTFGFKSFAEAKAFISSIALGHNLYTLSKQTATEILSNLSTQDKNRVLNMKRLLPDINGIIQTYNDLYSKHGDCLLA